MIYLIYFYTLLIGIILFFLILGFILFLDSLFDLFNFLDPK